MKTLYYTVTKQLNDIDGVEETNGFKDIRIYDIIDNKPLLITEIEAENEYSSLDEINHFVEITMMEEDFETHLDKEETYTFQLI
jgi:hypothetical protein